MTAFTRSLGSQSGVQLNEVIDDSSSGLAASNIDQIFATVGRFQRGRIDKSFYVDPSTLAAKLGPNSSIQISALNECYTHVYNALNNGAVQGVISRLVPAAAVNSYMVFSLTTAPVPIGSWTVSAAVPATAYGLLVQHLECHNDGVTIQLGAVQNLVSGVAAATNMVRLQLIDNQTGLVLSGYDFTGSLLPSSVDEYGVSNYLPNVVSALTGSVVVQVGASFTTVPAGTAFYGLDVNGNQLWNTANLNYFTEGGTIYASTDYANALTRLRYSSKPFGYLMSGGSQSPVLLSQMIAMGDAINVQTVWDVPGSLSPAAAITFVNSLSISTRYSQCYWAPLTSTDPLNGGKFTWGTSCDNVAMRCARNARTDGNGLAPKNYPVAGSSFPLSRTSITQTYTPTDPEMSALADARINPVIFVRYNSSSKYVFFDSLTGANTTGGTKLINVTEMATSVDDMVTLYAQQCVQLPMATAIKRMSKFLKDLFAATDAADWTTASNFITGNLSNTWTVAANAQRPFDRMDVNYWVHYDGTARAIYVQQTVSR